MKDQRIYICGPSGTGKTTLATWIADKYDLPFITTSTKPLWRKLGVRSHKELITQCQADKDFGLEFQHLVLNYRMEKLGNEKRFVTDRSPVDSLAYFLMQNADQCTEEETKEYIRRCNQLMAVGTKLINVQFTTDIKLEDDGMRITNPYYQEYSSMVFKYILNNRVLDLNTTIGTKNFLDIHTWDIIKRMTIVHKFLKERNGWLRRN
jgi:deoxyadenosine/deoxycytidine kinase